MPYPTKNYSFSKKICIGESPKFILNGTVLYKFLPMNTQTDTELSPADVDNQQGQKLTDSSEIGNQILDKLDHLESGLDSLGDIFEQRLTYDKEKEKAFDLLYTELQALKENSAFDSVKSLYLDLILLLDRVENIKESITDDKIENRSDSIKNILTSVSEEVLEILLRQQIEVIQTVSGTPFNPSCQKAIQTQETDVESENNKVFSIVRRGFHYGNRILRPEEVIVSKYHRA
jgi:molecular chaperone GrpE (heat shock protein)